MPTIVTPDAFIFGTPASITFGGDEVGATMDPPIWTCTPTLYKPVPQNAVGPLKGLVFITEAEVKAEITVNEFTALKLGWAWPGAEEAGGIITWSPGRVADAAFKTLILEGLNLAGNILRVTIPNALPEGAVSITFSKTEVSGMKLTFVGYGDPDTPLELPFGLELGAAS